MSSLNITAEIKAPRLRLIETQEIKALSCLWQYAGGAGVSGNHCLGLGGSRICIQGARLTHITSRRALISKSDNNYQEEYTQNDFFCDFYASPTQGRGDNSIRRKGTVSEGPPQSCLFD